MRRKRIVVGKSLQKMSSGCWKVLGIPGAAELILYCWDGTLD